MSKRIFISYSRADKRDVESLSAMLAEHHTVWYDKGLDETIGQDWWQTLLKEIAAADIFIFLISRESVESKYCRAELEEAQRLRKPIMPILVRSKTEIPRELRRIQTLNMIEGLTEDAKQKLLTSIENLDTNTDDKAPTSSEPTPLPGATEETEQGQAVTQVKQLLLQGNIYQPTVSGKGNIVLTGVSDTSVVVNEGRTWTVPVSLTLIFGCVAAIAAVFALVPEQDRNNSLHSIGLIPPTVTVTATATATHTPTATPSPTPTPSVQGFDIGVAVTYFAIPDDGSVDQREADEIVQQVDDRLRSEMEAFGDALDLSVGFIDPVTAGRIEGETPTEREANAREVADQYGADIVLYGVITANRQGFLEVRPEFYVLPESFSEALEMTGSFRLGREIEVEGPLSRIQNAMQVNRPLSGRTTAIAQIFGGLLHYILEDYDAALAAFQTAAGQDGWGETEGREVLYVLLGNTYGKIGSVAAQNRDYATAQTNAALSVDEYETAQDIAPDYSRPYAGLASSTYLQWSADLQETSQSDIALLEEALAYLDEAAAALDRPADIGIETKEIFTRMQVYFNLWTRHGDTFTEDELREVYENVERLGEQILRRYDNGNNPSVRELASEAHGFLGLADFLLREYDAGLDHFEQAIDLSPSAQRRMFFYGWTGQSYARLNQPEAAIEAYQAALELAESIGAADEQIQLYETEIENLRSPGRG